MNKYNYIVRFKSNNYKYIMRFSIEAESNDEAKIKGQERWNEQVSKRERLQNANILKITCRKIETKPRQPKQTPLQKAFSALNQYIMGDLENAK